MAETNVIGVRFHDASKIYHFAPPQVPVQEGEYVVVETARGSEMARVVTVPPEDAGPVPSDARPVVRLADGADRSQAEAMAERGTHMLERARALVAEHDLPMYAVAFQVNLAGSEATGHFQADGHVDFSPVVEAIESEFAIRVHMQQAGPRDRAKLVDGHDICGLRLCCSSWMTSFPKVSIRMAKEQSLALNPDKISGVCGRLLCCLTFEFEVYREMRGTLPKVGKRVSTPAGMGKVVQLNVLKQTVTLVLDDQAGRVEVPAAEIGMAVRVEEAPNQALVEELELSPMPGERRSRRSTPASARGADTREPREEAARDDRSRRRRRRGRRQEGARPPGAAPRDAGAPGPTPGARPQERRPRDPGREAGPPSGVGGDGDQDRPRRRRRRRRRRSPGTAANEGGGGRDGDGAGGAQG